MTDLIPDQLLRLNFPNLGINVRFQQISFDISQGLKKFRVQINRVAQQARLAAERVAGMISTAAGKVIQGAKDAGTAGLEYSTKAALATARGTRAAGSFAYNKRPLTVATATEMIGKDKDKRTLHEKNGSVTRLTVNQVLLAVETIWIRKQYLQQKRRR